MTAPGVQPVPVAEVFAPMAIRTTPSVSGSIPLFVTELCRRRGSRHSCQMFSSVTFQYRVSGGRNSSTSDSSSASRNVPIMYRLSGVVSASPRSAAAEVTSVLGAPSNSGLIVRCNVVSFIMVHAIAVNCSAASASGTTRGGRAVSGSMLSAAASSVAASAMYSRTTIDDASSGIGTHCAPTSSACVGSAAANTSANPPASSFRSVSLT